ncbi:hypothetical protein [Microcoleus sp. CZ3-B4]|uniref:hypothetical protein n=1 Tax=Microcoleus sp. CZ3-B4 TaxID=2818733 RepID=UPI002FCFF1F3
MGNGESGIGHRASGIGKLKKFNYFSSFFLLPSSFFLLPSSFFLMTLYGKLGGDSTND